jgi:hypothetical protein
MSSSAVSQAQLDAAGRVQAVVLGRLNTLHKARMAAAKAASSAKPSADASPDPGGDTGSGSGSGSGSGGASVAPADSDGSLHGPVRPAVFRGPEMEDPDRSDAPA